MIDWTARARSILAKTPQGGTAETAKTPISAVLAVGTQGVFVDFECLDRRLAALIEIGAIDADDAEIVRRRYAAYPEEWDFVLACCEQAAKDRQ